MSIRPFIVAAFSLVAAFLLLPETSRSQAREYPNRPVRILVPYAPGGPTDQLVRAISERLALNLKQPIVVENKPGANTIIAAKQLTQSQPDGYTLFLASSASLAVNPLVYAKLPYDADADFAPISLVARAPLVLVVNAKVPVKTAPELISYINNQKGRFAFASNGNGNPLHLACELFKTAAGLDMIHVPYSGTAPALTSVIAGDTQMSCDIVLSALPQIKAGALRPIAIVGPKRVSVLPAVPTLAEQGLPAHDAAVWFALVAPKGTPEPIVKRLNQELAAILSDAGLRDRFNALAMELVSSTPQEVTALTERERSKWAPVVRKYEIKVE